MDEDIMKLTSKFAEIDLEAEQKQNKNKDYPKIVPFKIGKKKVF